MCQRRHAISIADRQNRKVSFFIARDGLGRGTTQTQRRKVPRWRQLPETGCGRRPLAHIAEAAKFGLMAVAMVISWKVEREARDKHNLAERGI